MYAFATSGEVVHGLDEEIRECLDMVEHGRLDLELDPVEEHARLTAFLHEVEPALAVLRAGGLGRAHGENAAAWWHQDTLGGRASGDTAATARRVLHGIEDGDPEIADALTVGDRLFAPRSLPDLDAVWPRPDIDDQKAHGRWVAAERNVQEAYRQAFSEAFQDSVAERCRSELSEPGTCTTVDAPVGPYIRPARDEPAPSGWIAEPIGLWEGDDSEVVYDPRRADVSVTYSATPATAFSTAAAYEAAGWEPHAVDSSRRLWVRDRADSARQSLGRFAKASPAPEPATSRGLEL